MGAVLWGFVHPGVNSTQEVTGLWDWLSLLSPNLFVPAGRSVLRPNLGKPCSPISENGASFLEFGSKGIW